MSFRHLNVGAYRIHVTAYNPADALSLLYCEFCLDKLVECVDGISDDAVRAYLAGKHPDVKKLFEMIDDGWELPRATKIGEYPVAPTNAKEEARIIHWLQRERQAGGRLDSSSV